MASSIAPGSSRRAHADAASASNSRFEADGFPTELAVGVPVAVGVAVAGRVAVAVDPAAFLPAAHPAAHSAAAAASPARLTACAAAAFRPSAIAALPHAA